MHIYLYTYVHVLGVGDGPVIVIRRKVLISKRNGRAQDGQQDHQGVRVRRILRGFVRAVRGTVAGERSGFQTVL